MTIDAIIFKFKKNGYKIVRCMSGEIVVTKQFSKVFSSYNAAYRYYFNN